MLNIAFVSYEYEGGAHGGGIGTYVRNAAFMLAARGHSVEVFTSGAVADSRDVSARLKINTVACEPSSFARVVSPVFAARHGQSPFDVAEGAEYRADTAEIAKELPDLPLVLKLHTPSALIERIDASSIPLVAKARFVLGGLRRGKISKPYWHYNSATDFECDNLRTASEITAPSRAIVQALGAMWPIDPADVRVIPNVFVAPASLTEVKADTRTGLVTFIGRLENRKGVFDLAAAIPLVLRRMPDARFRFVGRSLGQPGTGQDIGELLRERLKSCMGAVEFIDSVPYGEVHRYYKETDICVFPSLWENFPNVCLEAMAAARGVIGSSAGGMAEIIEHGRTGLLVPPRNPRAIADAIVALLRHPERRMEMGRAAREHVTTVYAPDVIGPLQEASYARAIERAKVPCPA